MKKIISSGLLILGLIVATTSIKSISTRETFAMKGNRMARRGTGNGMGQRRMDGTGPRAQRGECIRNIQDSDTVPPRLGMRQGRRNGTGQRRMDGTGPRAQRGECIRNTQNGNTILPRLGMQQGRRNGTGQRRMDGTGPRAQRGECIRNTQNTNND